MPRRRRRLREFGEIDHVNDLPIEDCDALQLLKGKLCSSTASHNVPITDADFVVKCGDYVWRIHMDKLAQKSKYFQVMARSDFKEASQGVIDLSEEEPQLLVRLFQYAYLGFYAVGADEVVVLNEPTVGESCKIAWKGEKEQFKSPKWEGGRSLLHLNMFAAADYFMLDGMEEYSLSLFGHALTNTETANEVFECIEALEALEDIGKEKLDLVLRTLVQSLNARWEPVTFSLAQKRKIALLTFKFEKLGEIESYKS